MPHLIISYGNLREKNNMLDYFPLKNFNMAIMMFEMSHDGA